jgi:hypothetical protein
MEWVSYLDRLFYGDAYESTGNGRSGCGPADAFGTAQIGQ